MLLCFVSFHLYAITQNTYHFESIASIFYLMTNVFFRCSRAHFWLRGRSMALAPSTLPSLSGLDSSCSLPFSLSSSTWGASLALWSVRSWSDFSECIVFLKWSAFEMIVFGYLHTDNLKERKRSSRSEFYGKLKHFHKRPSQGCWWVPRPTQMSI